MYWWIITWIVLAISIICTIIAHIRNQSSFWTDILFTIIATIGYFIFIILLIICVCEPISIRQEVNHFEQQKAYIETHIATESIENAALTDTKISLNSWLYDAQYWENNYPGWCFYPKEVKNLTPIK